jgi:hypothetical protein
MAKMTATENAQTVIDAAVQMFGGRGVKVGETVESLYREIRALRIYDGDYRSAKADRGARTSQARLSGVNYPLSRRRRLSQLTTECACPQKSLSAGEGVARSIFGYLLNVQLRLGRRRLLGNYGGLRPPIASFRVELTLRFGDCYASGISRYWS